MDCVQIDTKAKTKIEAELRSSSPGLNQASYPLPPPSSKDSKWWETHTARDIPLTQGNNPFYDFKTIEKPTINASSNSIPPAVKKPIINLMD